jgi:hypothetical protein
MKVLTIGNSFANNATVYIKNLAEASAKKGEFVIGKTNLGGCSLEKHWNLVEQCDRLSEVKPYDFTMTGAGGRALSLRAALVAAEWDYITLQQASILSWRPETYFPYLHRLRDLLGELAPQAQPVIHQTWAYRSDAPLFAEEDLDQDAMFQRLDAAYKEAAASIGARILPVGAAFQKARRELVYVPDASFDFAHAEPLALPDQTNSLIVGWRWLTGNTASGKAELNLDAKHANAKGCYIGNAVWFEMFMGESLVDHSFCPEGVSVDELAILKRAAREAVEQYGGPLKG